MTPRVAITGTGVVCPEVWGGSARLSGWLGQRRPVSPGARVEAGVLAGLLEGTDPRRWSRISQLTVAAARLALADADLAGGEGLGLVVGTELGDLRATMDFADGYLTGGPAGLSALLFPNTVMNTMASAATIAVGARARSLTLNAPGVAGHLAVVHAAAAVAAGRVEAALAGGVDEADAFVAETLAGLGAPGPRGEGAAFLVLEQAERARARGARVLGELRGWAAGALPARPGGIGRATRSRAVPRALGAAGLDPVAVGWIYGPAGGDDALDRWQERVLEEALGARRPAAALARALGQQAALGPLAVAAAAWTAGAGRLPRIEAGDHGLRLTPVPVAGGPGLVHGLARGGGEAALVVAGSGEDRA